jgi:hypothetical protein
LLAFAIHNERNGNSVPSSAPHLEAMVAMIWSNQNYAAYLPDSVKHARNQLDSCAWATGGGSNSSQDLLSPARND